MKLRDIMTRNVETVSTETTLRDAAFKMDSADVGVLPVCDNDRLVGVITDRDIVIRSTSAGQDPNRARVGDAMTADVDYCYEDDDLEKAANHMREKQIRRMLVLTRERRLAGIISLGDLAVRAGEERLSGKVNKDVASPQAHPDQRDSYFSALSETGAAGALAAGVALGAGLVFGLNSYRERRRWARTGTESSTPYEGTAYGDATVGIVGANTDTERRATGMRREAGFSEDSSYGSVNTDRSSGT